MNDFKSVRILMIGGQNSDAAHLRGMLESVRSFAFYFEHVKRFSTGQAHLRNLDDPVDIVLLDLRLPDGSGLNTIERVSHESPWTTVILIIEENDEKLALQAVRNGAQDYLVKGQMNGSLLVKAIKYAIERKRVEDSIRESEERYKLAIHGANDGLWDWDLKSNRIYFSPRWKSMLGFSEDVIGDDPGEWLNRIHPEDIEHFRLALLSHIKGSSGHFESEYRMQRADGSFIWILARGLAKRNEQGIAFRMAGSQTDITVRKQTEEQLLHDAFHDTLTNLPNRTWFIDRLGQAIKRSQREFDYRYAVLYMDLDRFKVINDSLGYRFGDQLLISISAKLRACLRSGDTVARLGGDEFVILMEGILPITEAMQVAERIQRTLQIPTRIGNQEVVTSASIGIVLNNMKYKTPEDALCDADIAMYQAKMQGKACCKVFEPWMRKLAITRMGLENDLRLVLENEERLQKELHVEFQPIISLKNGRITGFEALVRWTHPIRGTIQPAEFIPIAEETGLIHLLGLWVLRAVCKQAREWKTRFAATNNTWPTSVNVNVSGAQLSKADLVENIARTIREFDIEPSMLNLEITESWFMEGESHLRDTLDRIRRLGINLQVDDFGRGSSSLSSLQNLPVNSLKIDSAFIRHLDCDKNNSEIVRSIVGLSKNLGLSVIAEGVETERQYKTLKQLGCPYVQGFYFSRPVSGERAEEMVRKNWNVYAIS